MTRKILGVFAVLLLLGACSSTKDMNESGGVGQPPAPGSRAEFVQTGDRVYFDLDSSRLNGEGQQVMQRQAAWLKKWPNVRVTIEGHADERGTREYNLALGQQRATAMKNYLISQGVAASRVRVVSYGKERPVVEGHGEVSWAENRRGVTVPENTNG